MLVDQPGISGGTSSGHTLLAAYPGCLDLQLDRGPGLLALAPIQHQALGFERVQQLVGNCFDFFPLFTAELGVGLGEQVE